MKIHSFIVLVSSAALAAQESSDLKTDFPRAPDAPARIESFEAAAAGADYSAKIDSIEAKCLALLASEDIGKKYAGIRALGRLRSVRAVDKLVGFIDFRLNISYQENGDIFAQYPACAALVAIGCPALKALRQRLEEEKKEDLKRLIKETIARIGKQDG